MSEKTLSNIRIINKHDTEANWLKATGFTPKQGELIVYDIDDNYNYERIKIGDGVQNVNDLPFVTEAVDWNDLLNRPFGEVSEYYVDKCTVECTDIHYMYVHSAKSVIIGETYTVIFDGVEYECECLDYKRFGNLSLYYDDEEDTGEPFLLRYDGMVNGYVLTVAEIGIHTISIEQKIIECIDEKYIPETIARISDIPSLDSVASESYVNDKIAAFVGDTTVAEQIEDAITEFKDSEDNFSGSWNDLTDKPFEATYAYHIVSDGNKEGLLNYMGFYRVSDLVPSIEDFANGFVFKAAHESVEQVYTADDVSVGDMFWDGSTAVKFYQGPYFAVLQQDTTSPDNGTILTRGTYFLSTTSLAHTLKVGQKNILDDACISDNIARVSDVEDAISAITIPDVSGQINAHNESETAHSDIRDALREVSELVGDTAVSEQIEAAQIVYVGPDRPTDPNIKVWINTAEEGTGVVPVLPRIASITLVESAWTGSKEPYSQSVEIATVTTASKIDLQPTAQQIVDLQNAEISLMVENNGGVVTCYAIGNKPTVDYTMQVLIQEVSYV